MIEQNYLPTTYFQNGAANRPWRLIHCDRTEFKHELGSGARAWHHRAMSTITVQLPDEDFAFLRVFSAAQGTSAEAFLARQARNLREHLQRPLQPGVMRATGIIAPEVSGEETYREHLEKKHA